MYQRGFLGSPWLVRKASRRTRRVSDWVYACLERNKFIGETEGCGELPGECTVVTTHVKIRDYTDESERIPFDSPLSSGSSIQES